MKNSCLTKDGDQVTLVKSIYCRYCDFVIRAPNCLFRERVLADFEIWDKHHMLALNFHHDVIVPELLDRYFLFLIIYLYEN